MMKNYLFLFGFLFFGMLAVNAQQSGNGELVSNQEEVDNFIFSEAIEMYPNPVMNYLTIRSKYPITEVQILSLVGEPIKRIRKNFYRIDLRNVPSGIYMIKIYSNQFSATKKLIRR